MSRYNKDFWITVLGQKWAYALKDTLVSSEMIELMEFLDTEYSDSHVIHPLSKKDVFTAFKYCPFENLKVVILGTDPSLNYDSNGIAFGHKFATTYLDETLYQLRRRTEIDFHKRLNMNFDTTLESWAEQGVLLLNLSLTARRDIEHSHFDKWQFFIKAVLKVIEQHCSGIIFMMWGSQAQEYRKLFINKNHYFLRAKHPTDKLSLYEEWETDNFIKANTILHQLYGAGINW